MSAATGIKKRNLPATDPDAKLRARWRAWCVRRNERWLKLDDLRAEGLSWDEMLARCPPMPDERSRFVGLTCGARNRKGGRCGRHDLQDNGRCWLHGGASTGPTTPEGKEKAARNGLAPKQTP